MLGFHRFVQKERDHDGLFRESCEEKADRAACGRRSGGVAVDIGGIVGESSFGEVISVLPEHADPERVAEEQVLRMTSSMADPAGKKLSNKCNLL